VRRRARRAPRLHRAAALALSARVVVRALAALARQPGLWVSAGRVFAGLVPSHWWSRPPFLPLPDSRWLAFRSETAYGDATQVPGREDIVAFVEFAREQRQLRRAL
jgi:hypothetical protein